MSKKKKIVLLIAVLLLIGLGVGAFLYFRKKEEETTGQSVSIVSKDRDGNTLVLSSSKSTYYPDNGYGVLVNGQEDGALATLALGSDGYYRGTTIQGTQYIYQQGWKLA